jgi:hypothetical protein
MNFGEIFLTAATVVGVLYAIWEAGKAWGRREAGERVAKLEAACRLTLVPLRYISAAVEEFDCPETDVAPELVYRIEHLLGGSTPDAMYVDEMEIRIAELEAMLKKAQSKHSEIETLARELNDLLMERIQIAESYRSSYESAIAEGIRVIEGRDKRIAELESRLGICRNLVDTYREQKSDRVVELEAMCEELSDDLAAEIEGCYNPAGVGVHPAMQWRYDRDMDPVKRARELIHKEEKTT